MGRMQQVDGPTVHSLELPRPGKAAVPGPSNRPALQKVPKGTEGRLTHEGLWETQAPAFITKTNMEWS